MVVVATFIGTPIGILAGIYLAEFGKNGAAGSRPARASSTTSCCRRHRSSSACSSTTIYVAQVGHFSGWAGSLALALIAIPVVVRTTENMLRLVPDSLREAAFALGDAACGR